METHPEQSSNSEGTKGLQAKLPKLTITPFNGSYQNWPCFWGQFVEAIDKTGIARITKFTYLRELLGVKVKKSVEALPFTSEGYNRAKSLLQDRYGKESDYKSIHTPDLWSATYSNRKRLQDSRVQRGIDVCCLVIEEDKEIRAS